MEFAENDTDRLLLGDVGQFEDNKEVDPDKMSRGAEMPAPPHRVMAVKYRLIVSLLSNLIVTSLKFPR
jgi:hypothetical protein